MFMTILLTFISAVLVFAMIVLLIAHNRQSKKKEALRYAKEHVMENKVHPGDLFVLRNGDVLKYCTAPGEPYAIYLTDGVMTEIIKPGLADQQVRLLRKTNSEKRLNDIYTGAHKKFQDQVNLYQAAKQRNQTALSPLQRALERVH